MEEKIIPSTRRPDGTWRKEIRVKAGYTPQDEVGAFETTASRMKSGVKTIPGYHPTGETKKPATKTIPGYHPIEAKRKSGPQNPPKHQKSNPSGDSSVQSNADDGKSTVDGTNNNLISEIQQMDLKKDETEEDPTKRLRKIKKKLREINELEGRIQSGSVPITDEIKRKIAQKGSLESEVTSIEASLESN